MTKLLKTLKRVFLCQHKVAIIDVTYDGRNLAERCICMKCGQARTFKANINSLC